MGWTSGFLAACCALHGGSAVYVRDLRTTASSARREPLRRAAICFAGGFRNFLQTAPYHKTNIVDPWPAADVFFFLELEDTWTRYHADVETNHSRELPEVSRMLNPVAVRTYTQEEAHSHQRGIACLSEPTISHQLWAITECFSMATQHEKDTGNTYNWLVRARPDAVRLVPLKFQLFEPHASVEKRIAWRKKSGLASDTLFVITRAAAIYFGSAHDSLFRDVRSGRCAFGSVDADGSSPKSRQHELCDAAWSGNYHCRGVGPECLLYLAWVSNNVTVVFDNGVAASLTRPGWSYISPHGFRHRKQ